MIGFLEASIMPSFAAHYFYDARAFCWLGYLADASLWCGKAVYAQQYGGMALTIAMSMVKAY